jgi:hypothetical protein
MITSVKKGINAPGGHQAETETLRAGLGVADVEDALQRLLESGDLLLLGGKGAHSPEVGDDLPIGDVREQRTRWSHHPRDHCGIGGGGEGRD